MRSFSIFKKLSLRPIVCAFILAISLLFIAPQAHAAPANDNIANAQLITGESGSVAGTNVGATAEAVDVFSGGASVWYRWVAPVSDYLNVSAIGSNFENTVQVFTGDVAHPRYITGDVWYNYGSSDSAIYFKAQANITYYISVSSRRGETGTIKFNWAHRPPNDDFAHAQILGQWYGGFYSTNMTATRETGEPNHLGEPQGHSVWYRWTAPLTARFVFDTSSSYFDTVVVAYTGTALGALTPVASNDDGNLQRTGSSSRMLLDAIAGRTYYIAVDGYKAACGGFWLNWSQTPKNDNFAEAQVLTGDSGLVVGSNTGASAEPDDTFLPNHNIWYRWTAPRTGYYNFTTRGSNFNVQMVVATGQQQATLKYVEGAYTQGGFNPPPVQVTFWATAGTSYYITIDGYGEFGQQTNVLRLGWSYRPSPSNDMFAGAQVLNSAGGTLSTDLTLATHEPGERLHAGKTGTRSLWYRWTAPATGFFSFHTQGSQLDHLLEVYTGNTLATLISVASSDNVPYNQLDPGHDNQSNAAVSFRAVAGRVYYIVLDGYPTYFNTYLTSRLTWAPAPGNDNFVAAAPLTGATGLATGSNAGAVSETGETGTFFHSVWFRWKAPFSGPAYFSPAGSSFSARLSLFIGSSLRALTAVAANGVYNASYQADAMQFKATAGTDYWIRVDSLGAVMGAYRLAWGQGIANDNWAGAYRLYGTRGMVMAHNTGATAQAGEPAHAGVPASASLWYKWVAPASGKWTFAARNQELVDTVLAVYTGNTLETLKEVGSNDDRLTREYDSDTRVSVTAGTTYFIAVDGYHGAMGSSHILWAPTPANDDFAAAQMLTGYSGSVNGTDWGATAQDDDNLTEENTVWYRWKSSTAGSLSVSAIVPDQTSQYLQVFTGADYQHLTLVTDTYYGFLSFHAAAGVTYYIRKSHQFFLARDYKLNWTFAPYSAPAKTTLSSPGSTPADKAAASPVGISSLAARAADGTITLGFSAALDAASTVEAGHYTVQINGHDVVIEGVSYAASANRVTLMLSEGLLRRGDTVRVWWTNLTDSRDRIVSGSTGEFQAN